MDYVYEGDAGCQPLHFICGATPQMWLLSWSWFQKLFKWLARQICCTLMGSRSHVVDKNHGSDMSRAALLHWLIGREERFDFNIINLRCEDSRLYTSLVAVTMHCSMYVCRISQQHICAVQCLDCITHANSQVFHRNQADDLALVTICAALGKFPDCDDLMLPHTFTPYF